MGCVDTVSTASARAPAAAAPSSAAAADVAVAVDVAPAAAAATATTAATTTAAAATSAAAATAAAAQDTSVLNVQGLGSAASLIPPLDATAAAAAAAAADAVTAAPTATAAADTSARHRGRNTVTNIAEGQQIQQFSNAVDQIPPDPPYVAGLPDLRRPNFLVYAAMFLMLARRHYLGMLPQRQERYRWQSKAQAWHMHPLFQLRRTIKDEIDTALRRPAGQARAALQHLVNSVFHMCSGADGGWLKAFEGDCMHAYRLRPDLFFRDAASFQLNALLDPALTTRLQDEAFRREWLELHSLYKKYLEQSDVFKAKFRAELTARGLPPNFDYLQPAYFPPITSDQITNALS